MQNTNVVSEKIAQVTDLLEQIEAVNEMIDLHRKADDDFMLKQYQHRKEKFVKELKESLADFGIESGDLAA